MAKYSYEFKMKLVNEYLDGQGSCRFIAKKHGIHYSIVQRWVSNYKRFGEVGLLRSRQQQIYTFEFKLYVVELYLTSELSYREIALQVGMTNPSQITRWVMDYRVAGSEALLPKKKGRKRNMDKEKITHEIENEGARNQEELLKQLQEENLKLRIENAFLKEARRLRLEEENLLNELRESSAVSEETSN